MVASKKNISCAQDWMLIAALILAPMTELRIWKVGPAETFCLLWCITQYKHLFRIKVRDPFFEFWISFLCTILLGSCFGEWFYPAEGNIKNLVVWVYFAIISLATYAGLKRQSYEQLMDKLVKASSGAAVWYMLLYIYSKEISSFFIGARLWYAHRFTGGATNPHQVALLLCVVALVLLYVGIKLKGVNRWAMIALSCVALFLVYETQSTTALAAGVCGIVVLCVTVVFKTSRSRVVFALAIVLFIIVNSENLYEKFMIWVASDNNGMGRFEIFANFPTTFWKSPLFGLGPGTHAGGIEYHNTYLEVFAMGGLVGIVVFLVFSLFIFKRSYLEPCSLAVVTSLYVYGLAGFGMRRLVYWIVISFAVCIAEKKHDNESRHIE